MNCHSIKNLEWNTPRSAASRESSFDETVTFYIICIRAHESRAVINQDRRQFPVQSSCARGAHTAVPNILPRESFERLSLGF